MKVLSHTIWFIPSNIEGKVGSHGKGHGGELALNGALFPGGRVAPLHSHDDYIQYTATVRPRIRFQNCSFRNALVLYPQLEPWKSSADY